MQTLHYMIRELTPDLQENSRAPRGAQHYFNLKLTLHTFYIRSKYFDSTLSFYTGSFETTGAVLN